MNNEEKILQMLDLIVNEVSGLKGNVCELKDDVSGLKSDVCELKDDVSGLKGDVSELKGDVNLLKNDVSELKDGQKNLETRQENLENGQNILVKQVVKLTNDVEGIRQSQVRMENDLTEKIRALFDDRSINQDYFKSIKKSLAKIEDTLQTHSFMLIELGQRQEDQETELRLLRAEK